MQPSTPDQRRLSGDAAVYPAVAQPGDAPLYVTERNTNDVLLGRGAPTIKNEGNVRFRQLVRTRKLEYMSTGRHRDKDLIAREIIQQIADRGGRFLRPVRASSELETLGLSAGASAWRLAEEDAALEKVKQALRDKEPLRPSLSSSMQAAIADMNSAAQGIPQALPLGNLSALQGLGLSQPSSILPQLPMPLSATASQSADIAQLLRVQQQEALALQQLALFNQARPIEQQATFGQHHPLPTSLTGGIGGFPYNPTLSQGDLLTTLRQTSQQQHPLLSGANLLQQQQQAHLERVDMLRARSGLPSLAAIPPSSLPLAVPSSSSAPSSLDALLLSQRSALLPSSHSAGGTGVNLTAETVAAGQLPSSLLLTADESKSPPREEATASGRRAKATKKKRKSSEASEE